MDRKELLSKVLRAETNATRKAGRLRKQGVIIEGSKYDVRRDRSKIRKYNTRQLQAHLNRLNTFNNRKTQFVGGYEGTPLPKQDFEKYKRYESARNLQIEKRDKKFANIFLPNKNMTVAERHRKMTPDRPYVGDPSSNGFRQIVRDASQIRGEEALNTLIRDLSGKRTRSFIDKANKESLRQFKQMMDTIANDELRKTIEALTPEQFDFIWNDTSFANDLSLQYQVAKAATEDKDEPWHQTIFENASKDIRENLEIATKAFNAGR